MKIFYKDGKPHDGPNGEPAVTLPNGITIRYQNGVRSDGPNGEPCVVSPHGSVIRYRNGEFHDGPNGEPAISYSNGTVMRFQNGKLHGEPAMVTKHASVSYQNGVREPMPKEPVEPFLPLIKRLIALPHAERRAMFVLTAEWAYQCKKSYSREPLKAIDMNDLRYWESGESEFLSPEMARTLRRLEERYPA
jgi:hypothetical protein